MRNLCIIPARGGSKRIPRKNIRNFLGKPIIAYSIKAALSTELFDRVMVSTDDDEIGEAARQFGAEVPFFRSEVTSGDNATTAEVIAEVIDMYASRNLHFDQVCCLYATAPLVQVETLRKGYIKLLDGYQSVFPVVPFGFPIWRGLKFNSAGNIEMLWKEHMMSRSQDLTAVYHDAGQWYWLERESFMRNRTLYTAKSQAVILDELHAQDIDNLTDWVLAEMKYKLLH